MIVYEKLTEKNRELYKALRRNVEDNEAMLMGKDTSFVGTASEVPEEEVISAIKSVPCHYAEEREF